MARGQAQGPPARSPYVGMTFVRALHAFIGANKDDPTIKDMLVLSGPPNVDIFVPADCKEWRWKAIYNEVNGIRLATGFQGRYFWKRVLPSNGSTLGLSGLGRMRIDDPHAGPSALPRAPAVPAKTKAKEVKKETEVKEGPPEPSSSSSTKRLASRPASPQQRRPPQPQGPRSRTRTASPDRPGGTLFNFRPNPNSPWQTKMWHHGDSLARREETCCHWTPRKRSTRSRRPPPRPSPEVKEEKRKEEEDEEDKLVVVKKEKE
ncbi:uncharacterized protein EV422DRAFT_512298 [Fimicolochytrium jonesii]|uniref:uncharacterized protein n=1 Tax=Fimicolochytrium jonesii TaxID=1396493 RepID=UPI0022FF310F|nr:uncharacterized protein EV422DRAFT_512298 [Fimicolochytrium jonesii]KAI8827005.1 hypothetical protein EV422DRAFT_512298 [Fimicolochytrium jonesii]